MGGSRPRIKPFSQGAVILGFLFVFPSSASHPSWGTMVHIWASVPGAALPDGTECVFILKAHPLSQFSQNGRGFQINLARRLLPGEFGCHGESIPPGAGFQRHERAAPVKRLPTRNEIPVPRCLKSQPWLFRTDIPPLTQTCRRGTPGIGGAPF